MRKNLRVSVVVGIVLVLALALFSTCDLDFFDGNGDKVVYTDVEYSEDGSRVTIYLDGVGVPVSGRALNRDMARFSYNQLEVVFLSDSIGTGGTGSLARARWTVGQTASIRGVNRGDTTNGVDYKEVYTGATSDLADGVDNTGVAGGHAAVLFVGRDDGTLLGVGNLAWVDDPRGVHAAAGVNTIVFPETTSVTFLVTALYTFLEAADDGSGLATAASTFQTSAGAPAANIADYPGDVSTYTLASSQTIEGIQYPLYSLPAEEAAVGATYRILADAVGGYEADGQPTTIYNRMDLNSTIIGGGGTEGLATYQNTITGYSTTATVGTTTTLNQAIRLTASSAADDPVLLRIPSYQSNGRIYELIETYYYKIKATLITNNTVPAAGKASAGYIPTGGTAAPGTVAARGSEFNPVINILFNTTATGSGVFGFAFDIPVYAITEAASTNGGPAAFDWSVKPASLGLANYYLDDGVGTGGLVLMGVGVDNVSTDWLYLYCKWR